MLGRAPIIVLPVIAGLVLQFVHPGYEGLPEITKGGLASGRVVPQLLDYAMDRPLYAAAVSIFLSGLSAGVSFWSFRSVFNASTAGHKTRRWTTITRDWLAYTVVYHASVTIYLGLFLITYAVYTTAPDILSPWFIYAPILAFPILYAWLSLAGFALTLDGPLLARMDVLKGVDGKAAATLVCFYALRIGLETFIISFCLALTRLVAMPGPVAIGCVVSCAMLPFAIVRNGGYLLKVRLLRQSPLIRERLGHLIGDVQ